MRWIAHCLGTNWCHTEDALHIVNDLCAFWWRQGARYEMQIELERVLAHPHGVRRTAVHASARAELGNLLGVIGDYTAARPHFEEFLELACELGDRNAQAQALERLGWVARELEDRVTAKVRLTESLALFRVLGDVNGIAGVLNTLAGIAILEEDPARAEALLAESHAIAQREHLDPNTVGWTLNHLGHAAQLRGEYQRAAELHQESLAIFCTVGDRNYGLLWAYQSLGETALGLGRLDEAAHWLAQGLRLSQTLTDQASMSWCLAGLGSAAALGEEPERAARLWGAAERLRQAMRCRTPPAARATCERAVAIAHTQLDDAILGAAWAAGRALTVEQAIAEALGEA